MSELTASFAMRFEGAVILAGCLEAVPRVGVRPRGGSPSGGERPLPMARPPPPLPLGPL